MLFFFIRHGDPTYSPNQLTPLGEHQAEAIAKRLALYGIDQIYASTSNRAVQTAQPTCELLKKEVTLLDWCNETHAARDFNISDEANERDWCFQHKTYKTLFNSNEMHALGKAWYEHSALTAHRDQLKNGIERVEKETYALFSALGYEHDTQHNCYRATRPNDDRIALFAHAGFGMAFLSVVLDIPYPMFSTRFGLAHTGMTVIEFANKDGKIIPRALQVNSDAHLYREGLPTNYNNRLRF